MSPPALLLPDRPNVGIALMRLSGRGLAGLRVVAVAGSCAAMVLLASQGPDLELDYGVGIVPAVVPWVAAGLAILTAAASLRERWMSSAVGTLLLGILVVVTVWSVVILPFDALRVVGLVPLGVSAPGAAMRLCLLVGSGCAMAAAVVVRRAVQQRCAVCGRVLPGPLDRLPRWPVGVAVVASFVYPALRLIWALGGTFGTTGQPMTMDVVVAWAPVFAGAGLVVFAVALFVAGGPRWVRSLLGLVGVAAGLLLAMAGGLGAAKAATELLAEGTGSAPPGSDLMTWTFVLVYGSWFVAGIGIVVGGLRSWSQRRDDCPGCRSAIGSP